MDKKKILSKYDIRETVFKTSIQHFSDNDLNNWIGKESIPFLEKYVNDR